MPCHFRKIKERYMYTVLYIALTCPFLAGTRKEQEYSTVISECNHIQHYYFNLKGSTMVENSSKRLPILISVGNLRVAAPSRVQRRKLKLFCLLTLTLNIFHAIIESHVPDIKYCLTMYLVKSSQQNNTVYLYCLVTRLI